MAIKNDPTSNCSNLVTELRVLRGGRRGGTISELNWTIVDCFDRCIMQNLLKSEVLAVTYLIYLLSGKFVYLYYALYICVYVYSKWQFTFRYTLSLTPYSVTKMERIYTFYTVCVDWLPHVKSSYRIDWFQAVEITTTQQLMTSAQLLFAYVVDDV